ncbi:hypothetical protein Tco_0599578 [Tanacetum coccineum]
MDKDKGGSSGVNEEGLVEVKKKKSSGNNGGNKNFKPVSMKPKPQYRRKAKQSTKWANLKTTPSVGKKNVLTSGNGTFSLSNSFEALNVKNLVSEEVETEGECVLVDDDVKPLKNVDYSGDQDSEDEIESVDNEMATFLTTTAAAIISISRISNRMINIINISHSRSSSQLPQQPNEIKDENEAPCVDKI